MQRCASINSSSRIFPVTILWSGCGPARPRRYVPPWANASVTPMNGRAPAPAVSNRRITALTWPVVSAPSRRLAGCGRLTTMFTKKTKTWSYGPEYRKGVCGAASIKTQGCPGGGWTKCGSNTYPSGYFPDCRSRLQVYDLNGNAAEHMNLPINENQMASRGSKELGYTEMKGSWFIFDTYRAHEDWCRWRAPFWHGSRVMDPDSHHNYHLGFRCCKSIE